MSSKSIQWMCLIAVVLLSGCDGATPQANNDPSQRPIPAVAEATEAASDPSESAAEPESQSETEDSQQASTDLAAQLKREQEEFKKQTIEIPATWKRFTKEPDHVWVDPIEKQVIIRGTICLQEGLLEMFACPPKTKEHESIVSVHGKAWNVHACLVAIGVEPGHPTSWVGKYQPASGPVINIEAWWSEDGKLIKRNVKEMIRNTDTGKPMQTDFVFGGSEFFHDPHAKKDIYYADSGEMINVANSSYAMIDIAVASSSDAEKGLLFEALKEKIPPVNTKVYLVLKATGKIIKADDPPDATGNSEDKSDDNPSENPEPEQSDPTLDDSSS